LEVILDMLMDMAVVLATLGIIGLTTSWALLHRFKPRTVVLTGALTMGFFASALYFLPQWGHHSDGGSLLAQYFGPKQFEADWKANLDSMSKMGVDTDKLTPFKDLYRKYVYFSLPAWEAIRCLLWGLLAYYAASSILSRITTRVPRAIAFREWIVPEPLVFGLIAGGSLKLFALDNGPLDILADNLLVFFVGLYTLAGFSIVSFFLYKWRFPRMLRLVGYIVIFWLTFCSVCCLGILDVWFDFRKIKSSVPLPPVGQ
jgi:hypothetical protein